MSRLTLVVPCYNEERRLDVEAFRQVSLRGHEVDFLFVNDGSRDGTLRVLQTLRGSDPQRFAVLNLEKNSGKAEAVRRGILAALDQHPDFVGFWDADLATPFSELPGFLEILEARTEIHIVMGARVRLLGREISRRPARHYVGRVGATLISSSLGLAVYDTQCGAKIFRASDTLRDVFSEPFLSRWIFDVEIIARYIERWGRDAVAGSVYELPVMRWHDVTGSKVKSHDFLRALHDLWKIRRAYRNNAKRVQS
ncbi:MAG: dolichyl-phosphate beta-glucosyltransferase [Thermoanaerobaculia bacterium]|nr:dolichyl-phosphate beta-glucosyltransferase [Thermoanaerobaculia bacterium]